MPADLDRVAGVRQVEVDPGRDQQEPGEQAERPTAARSQHAHRRRRNHRHGEHHPGPGRVERPERVARDPVTDTEQVVRAELVAQRSSEVVAQPVEPERRLEHERLGGRDPTAPSAQAR